MFFTKFTVSLPSHPERETTGNTGNFVFEIFVHFEGNMRRNSLKSNTDIDNTKEVCVFSLIPENIFDILSVKHGFIVLNLLTSPTG